MDNDLMDYNTLRLQKEIKAGKETAFDQLFRSRYKKMCCFSYTFVGNFDVAEDIVQEIFSKIWIKKTELSEEIPIDSYLFTAVRNGSLSYLRNKKQTITIEKLTHEIVSPESSNPMPPELESLWKAIEELPEHCRLVFKLVVFEEMTYQDAANALALSPNTVKTQMRIAYKTLREKLNPQQLHMLLWVMKTPPILFKVDG